MLVVVCVAETSPTGRASADWGCRLLAAGLIAVSTQAVFLHITVIPKAAKQKHTGSEQHGRQNTNEPDEGDADKACQAVAQSEKERPAGGILTHNAVVCDLNHRHGVCVGGNGEKQGSQSVE